MIRSCPADHPLLEKSKAGYPEGQRLILLSVAQKVDAHIAGVPLRMINFFNRTVLGRMWGNLLAVAEGVRDGGNANTSEEEEEDNDKYRQHREAIQKKQELYGWVEKRVQEMYRQADAAAAAAAAAGTKNNPNTKAL